MIAIMFFGAIVIWIALSVAIAIWLGNLLTARPWRIAIKFLLVPIIFFAPVVDEILAWPEMKALCDRASKYEFDEKTARGRTIRRAISVGSQENITLFPDIKVLVERYDHVDEKSGERVVSWYQITTHGGKFGIPSSSGEHYPLILPQRCSVKASSAEHIQLLRDLNIVQAKPEGGT